jgi:glycosyltransferase involved in cell wall biosynthesis
MAKILTIETRSLTLLSKTIRMDLSVIIPVYNEEGNIHPMYERLEKVAIELGVSWELIFVNDGSWDRSIELIKALAEDHDEVKFIDFSRNFGHQIALSAGLDMARGDAIVIIDADLQDPPEVILDLYRKMEEGFQVVYAKRRRRPGETRFKKITARLFYWLLSRITKVEIPLDTGDFRIIDRRVAEVLRRMPEHHKFLRGQISWIGFNQTFVEYERAARKAGATGYSIMKMIRFALDGITGFSDVPLRIVTFFGLIVSIFAFFVTLYALYARFILKDYVQGWTSLIITVLFIGGIQMIAIGIIGEYLSRMNANVRRRPLYIIRETNIEKPEAVEP